MAFHPLILVSSNLHICFRCFFRMRTQQCGFMGLVPERCLLFQQIHITASRAKISNLVDFGKGISLPSILGPLNTQISTILRLGSRWNISNKTLEMGPWVGLKAKRASSPNRYGFTEPDNPNDIVNINLELVLHWSSALFSGRHSRGKFSLRWRWKG